MNRKSFETILLLVCSSRLRCFFFRYRKGLALLGSRIYRRGGVGKRVFPCLEVGEDELYLLIGGVSRLKLGELLYRIRVAVQLFIGKTKEVFGVRIVRVQRYSPLECARRTPEILVVEPQETELEEYRRIVWSDGRCRLDGLDSRLDVAFLFLDLLYEEDCFCLVI